MSTFSPTNDKLKVFISSKMLELRDVREFVEKALQDRGIDAWVYETHAGARPEDVEETSFNEVKVSDIYVGLFWEKYGEVTVQEYRHARALSKPCFIYIRNKNCQRDKELSDFLKVEVYDLLKGVTYDYFDSALRLGEQISDDIIAWLVRRHREMTAEIRQARISLDEITRLQAEVNRLQASSLEQLPQGTAADYLAQQMRAWFETLGYRFEGRDIRADDYFEWIINVPTRRGYDRILVRGIEGEAEVSDVNVLRQAVDKHSTDEGWLVVVRRKSPAACEAIKKKDNRNLFCYTFDELLDENADFAGYLDWLESEIKGRGIDKMYVPLACTKEEFDPVNKQKIGESYYDERNGWIDGYIDRWLDDPTKEHISILGEFGTGKTWFALHYAWIAIQRYRSAKARGINRPRLPLVIPLRDYAKAVSVESLFSEFFFRKYEIPLPGYSAFEQLNRMGKLLLIFDGFDEMAAKVDRQKMINNFWELAKVVVPGSKVILTCRTEHFPEAKESRALLKAELQASTANLTGESPQFEVLELSHFNNAQIRKVLSFKAGPTTVAQVMNNHQLLDLARRPIMTELILDALPDIEAGKPVDLSRVYLYAMRHKMERDIKDERTFTSLADKLYFLCEVSWEMLSTDQMSLNYRLFPERLRTLFGLTVQEQKDLDHWHYDMMGQTMVIRNADGDYTPAHRSLLEFFVAYKFAAETGVLAPDFIEPARMQSHIDKSISPQNYTWSSYFQRIIDKEGIITPISPLCEFTAEGMDKLAATVGMAPITKAILDLMQNMLIPENEELKTRLLAIISGTRGKTTEEVGFIGANIIGSLIHRDPLILKGCNLSLSNLNKADFGGADLTGCNFQGANLQYVQFRRTILEKANLDESNLFNAQFIEMKYVFTLSFSHNGTTLASGGDDSNVHIWEVVTGRDTLVRLNQRRVSRVTFDSLGYFLGVLAEDQILFWNIQDLGFEKMIASVEFIIKPQSFCFNPMNSQEVTIGGANGIVTINLSTGATAEWKNDRAVTTLRYFSDGKHLAIGFVDRFAILDLETHYVSYSFKDAFCNDLCLSKDNNYAVIYYPFARKCLFKICLIEPNTFAITHLHSIENQVDYFPATDRICFLGNDKLVAITNNADISIIDVASGNYIAKFIGHKAHVTAFSLSPDGNLLASGSNDANIKFWDVRTFITRSGEPHINMIEYSPSDLSVIKVDPATWPEWWQKCKIDVPEGMLPNPEFGKCLRTIEQKLNCKGLQLIGAKGLDAVVEMESVQTKVGTEDRNITLGEWLAQRGAILR